MIYAYIQGVAWANLVVRCTPQCSVHTCLRELGYTVIHSFTRHSGTYKLMITEIY